MIFVSKCLENISQQFVFCLLIKESRVNDFISCKLEIPLTPG